MGEPRRQGKRRIARAAKLSAEARINIARPRASLPLFSRQRESD
jgi:hypothetical protein